MAFAALIFSEGFDQPFKVNQIQGFHSVHIHFLVIDLKWLDNNNKGKIKDQKRA